MINKTKWLEYFDSKVTKIMGEHLYSLVSDLDKLGETNDDVYITLASGFNSFFYGAILNAVMVTSEVYPDTTIEEVENMIINEFWSAPTGTIFSLIYGLMSTMHGIVSQELNISKNKMDKFNLIMTTLEERERESN